jgi:hypothetical protein
MNRQDYIQFHKEMCDLMVAITEKKNHDYSRSDDPFANFRVIGSLGLNVEQGFITRMSDKLSRLANFTLQGEFKVTDESFTDTCLDLANYALLLAGYHKASQEQESAQAVVEGEPHFTIPAHAAPRQEQALTAGVKAMSGRKTAARRR